MGRRKANGFVNTLSEYSILDIVGKGTYGEVFKAVHIASGDIVALKKICYTDVGIPKSSTREIRLLSALKHPNIEVLREVVVDDMKKDSSSIPTQFYMVFDYVENDLAGIVRAVKKQLLPPLSCHVVRVYIYQIVEVLDFLHGCNIIHRDIKLDNFLVTNDHHILLTDFGLSRQILPNSGRLSLPVFALAYRAPEILMEMQTYSMPADIWALGVLISTMLLGHMPFSGSNDREVMLDILHKCGVVPWTVKNWLKLNDLEIPCTEMRIVKTILMQGKGVSFSSQTDRDNLLDLCDRLLDLNPDMRPTTQQILLHPFFKDMLPASQLVKISALKKCEQPLLNMVIRNLE